MWKLYHNATTLSQKPSQMLPNPLLRDPWWAYQFDSAVAFFGVTISNALQEMDEVASEQRKKLVNKYTLGQLLTPGFILPGKEEDEQDREEAESLKSVEGMVYYEVGG